MFIYFSAIKQTFRLGSLVLSHLLISYISLFSQDSVDSAERYRPLYHFTPERGWMNDPNGLVYDGDLYHLFYQYYPNDIVWGPMHWGHATSTNLITWQHKPIALYPDSNGYIFSGSAVLDKQNSSHFSSRTPPPPLVAIFTYHDPKKEKEGRKDYQKQGLAYSLDLGVTWTKYPKPIIDNRNNKDFRDPKVFWYGGDSSWRLALAVGDHIELYSSRNLLKWKKDSEFGKKEGAHGGVWECPDLIELPVEGTKEKKWVLLLNMNPGAPNGGSGTQYFVGNYDGKIFRATQPNAWVDLGTDNYAGVTFFNTSGDKKVFLGWMSNWLYGQKVPTYRWRSAMTLPRLLSLRKHKDLYYLKSEVHPSVLSMVGSPDTTKSIRDIKDLQVITSPTGHFMNTFTSIHCSQNAGPMVLSFHNNTEHLSIRYDSVRNLIEIDRAESGLVSFEESFRNKITIPLPYEHYPLLELDCYFDKASLEIFVNNEIPITTIFFPTNPYDRLDIITSSPHTQIDKIRIAGLHVPTPPL